MLKMMKLMVFLAVILVFLVGCVDEKPDDTVVSPPNDQDNDDVDVTNPDAEDYVGFSGITKQQCTDAGGHWNTCGSPCAGTGADFCIEMCQVQCECGGIAGFGCPKGFKCRLSGKIMDEMGVCVEGQ